MFRTLRVRNFKAWQDTGPIRLAPITVLFGTNSSGKSSINQLLLMLKQTAESPDRKRVIHLGDRNSLIDVGTYRDMVFRHNTDLPLKFDLSWTLPRKLTVEDSLHDRTYRGSQIHFSAVVEYREGRRISLFVPSMNYVLGDLNGEGLKIVMERITEDESSVEKYELETHRYTLTRTRGKVWRLPPPIRFYGFPDEATAYYQNTGFLPDLTLELERRLGSLYYVGPLRQTPQRLYTWSGEIPEHVGWKGQRAIEAILAARSREINKGAGTHYRPFEEVIAEWLKKMKLIHAFKVSPIAAERKEYEVTVQVGPESPEVKLPDIGFGVSQVLPVIVECFYVSRNSTLIFEQPEIHLHPSVQAALADLFIETIRARDRQPGERGEARNIQLLIESHSEHFLRRLQRLIAEEKIGPDEVAIYFCEPSSNGSSIRELEVDLFGRISNWPDGFFGDLTGEVAAQTRTMLERIARQPAAVDEETPSK